MARVSSERIWHEQCLLRLWEMTFSQLAKCPHWDPKKRYTFELFRVVFDEGIQELGHLDLSRYARHSSMGGLLARAREFEERGMKDEAVALWMLGQYLYNLQDWRDGDAQI